MCKVKKTANEFTYIMHKDDKCYKYSLNGLLNNRYSNRINSGSILKELIKSNSEQRANEILAYMKTFTPIDSNFTFDYFQTDDNLKVFGVMSKSLGNNIYDTIAVSMEDDSVYLLDRSSSCIYLDTYFRHSNLLYVGHDMFVLIEDNDLSHIISSEVYNTLLQKCITYVTNKLK